MKPKKKFSLGAFFCLFVFISMALSIVFVTFRLITAPTTDDGMMGERVKSDYVLMLLQCILGIIVMILPGAISRRLKIEIPSQMMILFVIFLYCAIYLGEVRSFYYNIPHWDSILHAFSSAMIGSVGFSFVALLNNSERVPVNLSPLFVAVFAFCFAVSLGAIWEIYEFTADEFLHTNMQKFATADGIVLVGHAALWDTIKDIIIDTVGALTIAIIGYISLKYKKGWIEKLQIKRKKDS